MLKKRTLWGSAAPLVLIASAWGQTPLGEMFVTVPGGPSVEQAAGTGMAVLPGSELSAGMAPATLKLVRGGQVRICPRSHLSVNSGGEGLMLGMGVGATEIDYGVAAGSTDVIFTPDFEIRMAGPAHYHFALGLTSAGNTCFKPMLGNTAGVVFSELLGTEMFGIAADESALFPEGKIARRAPLTDSCGCPAPPPAKQVVVEVAPSPTLSTAQPERIEASSSTARGAGGAEATAPLPPEQPGQSHLEVETPFVFSGSVAAVPGSVAKIQFSSLPNTVSTQEDPEPVVLAMSPPAAVQAGKPEPSPTPAPAKKESKGFLARLKGFFGGLFHR